MIKYSVVLPSYNEENAIAHVIKELKMVLDKNQLSYEILVINDASTDKTAEVALEHGVRVINHPVNLGAGASRRTGIRNAQGEIIIMLDCDGSYNPEDIPALLKFFPEFDQVNGARRSEEGTMKILRVPTKWFIKKLACYLSGIDIPDLNTGLKAFKKDVMLKYLWVIPDGFSCVTTMTLAFLCNGHPVKWVEADYRKRIGISKFHPINDTFNYFLTVLRIMMYFKPLKVFIPMFFVFFATGIITSVVNILRTGGIQQIDIIIIIFSFMLGLVGLIADLIVAMNRKD